MTTVFSKSLRWLFLSLASFALAPGPAGADVARPQVEILYSGDLTGELEPCGCSETGNLGGLKRRATVIARIREKNPDTFVISSGGLFAGYSASERITAEYILKGMALLNYDAIGLQKRDLSFGRDFLDHADLPWVASSSAPLGFPKSRVIEKNGVRLAFFSWPDSAGPGLGGMQPAGASAQDDPFDLEAAIREAKQAGAITVLATTLPLEKARALISFDNLDILFKEASYEIYGEPRLLEKTLVLQPGARGMYLGHLKLTLDRNNRIAGFEHEAIAMPAKVPDAPQMEGWYKAYNDAVKANYLRKVEVRKKMKSGASPFSGAKACKACHQKEHETWSASKHARAYKTLSNVEKAFDPNCLACHTLGFNQDGGFIDRQLTAGFANVQCESCHGAARAHAGSGGTTPTPNHEWPRERMCAQCHNHDHSPDFDIERYWQKIAHP